MPWLAAAAAPATAAREASVRGRRARAARCREAPVGPAGQRSRRAAGAAWGLSAPPRLPGEVTGCGVAGKRGRCEPRVRVRLD